MELAMQMSREFSKQQKKAKTRFYGGICLSVQGMTRAQWDKAE